MTRWLRLVVAVLVFALGLASPLAAQTRIQVPVDNFRPAASTRNFYVTENGAVLGHLAPSVNLYASYARRPLQFVDTSTGDRRSEAIRYRLNLDLMVAMGFWDVLELGVVLPATAKQGDGNLALLDRTDSLKGGFRDMRIIPKVQAVQTYDGVLSLGIALPLTVPTGNNSELLGTRWPGFSPTAILSVDSTYFDLGINAGFRLRKRQDVAFSGGQPKLAVGSEVFGSLGVKIALVPDTLELVGDVFGSASVHEQDTEEVPIETLGGLRLSLPFGLVANAAGGAGLTRGLGAPEYRVILGLGYQHRLDDDPDDDGIRGDADGCPMDPEDKDTFQDTDGCPDLDNDEDGVLDTDDRCPLKPEDIDGFEDTDGCPDTDNDGDGILDADDQCPDAPEDRDNIDDADGCPDNDNDGDGILDDSDACPEVPEDKDGFEDTDGCPDKDNDGDGIADDEDECPMEAEDKDNFEDTDGCPDKDNDGDGILDVDDQCPNEPETINGNEDEDGCPDKAKGPVQIERGKITTPPVYFAVNKDEILQQSHPILEQVAETFKNNPWVKKVRIEGHTDSRGGDDFNLELSKRRAASVERFLVARGVEPERLETEGYGETQPIASNRSRAGRAKNRRVEFIILDPPQANE